MLPLPIELAPPRAPPPGSSSSSPPISPSPSTSPSSPAVQLRPFSEATAAYSVNLSYTLDGMLTDFDDASKETMQATISELVSVRREALTMRLEPASVRVSITIWLTSEADAADVIDILNKLSRRARSEYFSLSGRFELVEWRQPAASSISDSITVEVPSAGNSRPELIDLEASDLGGQESVASTTHVLLYTISALVVCGVLVALFWSYRYARARRARTHDREQKPRRSSFARWQLHHLQVRRTSSRESSNASMSGQDPMPTPMFHHGDGFDPMPGRTPHGGMQLMATDNAPTSRKNLDDKHDLSVSPAYKVELPVTVDMDSIPTAIHVFTHHIDESKGMSGKTALHDGKAKLEEAQKVDGRPSSTHMPDEADENDRPATPKNVMRV